jgi:hypothetical protein
VTISRVLAVAVLGLGISAGLSVQAQEGAAGPPPTTRPARGPRGGGGGAGGPQNLGGAMRDMGQNYKTLKANAADPEKRDESLRNVQMMERDAAVAKLSMPPGFQRLPADQKAGKLEDFRADFTELQKTLLSLEDAIAARNADDIKKGLDSIETIMNKGHEEFIPKKNGGGE